MELTQLLSELVRRGGSDLHLKPGATPRARVHGTLVQLAPTPLEHGEMVAFVAQLLNDAQKARVKTECDVDASYVCPDLGRFRVNVYREDGTFAIAVRVIPAVVPTIQQMGLPPVLRKLSEYPRGLILVTGTTGSGKSTTLAAMLNHINETSALNVITIEDPVEFHHTDKKSLVTHRAIGLDAPTYAHALKYVLRQDPDVILIGEMRDVETMHAAITAADTGHLVFSTLHTTDAAQTVERLITAHPHDERERILQALSLNLKAVISQRLLRRTAGGRVAALEIMVSTPTIRKQILDGEIKKLYNTIRDGASEGMQTFNQVILELFKAGHVTKEEALEAASRPEELILEMRTQGLG